MKQLKYTLKVHLPIDETYEKLVWHSIAPPHKFEYNFAPHLMKSILRDIKSSLGNSIKTANIRPLVGLK